ncbi:hypothetical protein [Halomonas nitroreducens]|uniref:Lipoprotein n=1 Tax=Halomonas nitroreducens TaxID=447425 RepID=A0A3S0JAD2_9GAMM|nr:hypothetical protein [Halomonas nitroreducens]RTR04375.1 hypothetical protein EKG36_08615 [Halomonas nitroreducens]
MPYHLSRHIALATVALATLAGCSSQDDASFSNFQNVLQSYYDGQSEPATCIAGTIDEFPYTKSDISWGLGNKGEQLDALAAADLVEQVGPETYQLTETGQSAFQPDKGFCFGTVTVTEVTNFTEPSERGGFTISQVNYTVDVEERPSWSQNETLVDTFELSDSGLRTSGLMTRNDNPEQKKMILVKTNNGWVTERDM